jgi:hypothetical protein
VKLSTQLALRLRQAGIKPDDAGLVALREWNRMAAERQIVRVELRRGQFGKTRLVRLDEVTQ